MSLFSQFFNEIFMGESITVLLTPLYVIFPPYCYMSKLANSFFKGNFIGFYFVSKDCVIFFLQI